MSLKQLGEAEAVGPVESTGDPDLPHPGRTAAWLGKQVEIALAEVDLSVPQYRVLALLDEGSAMSSALADRLAVRPPSITAVVDGLVTRGLVERRPGGADRRRVDLTLTAEGRLALARADAASEERLDEIAARLPSPAQQRRATEDLALWRRALVAHHLARHAALVGTGDRSGAT